MLTNKKGPEGRALILLFIFNPRFCDYLHSAGGGVKYPKAEFVQNLALSGTKFLLKKTFLSLCWNEGDAGYRVVAVVGAQIAETAI